MGIFSAIGKGIANMTGRTGYECYQQLMRYNQEKWEYVLDNPKRGENGYNDIQRTAALIIMAKRGSRNKAKEYFSAEEYKFKRMIKNFFAYDRWEHELDNSVLNTLGLNKNDFLLS